ncbi:5-hydroxytryptamine receptor 3A isoform X2 [Dasypus novemcinctus]|uniref:5-hydroxytryptamine receptor 3A isoform X2 n=1 Tax=Dasypus novemcinctus TaxID=9361 RepID=UPI00265FD6DF|nr:5-hydroxytryptamine receptor 3A isoform X2 [Dasypus novemcinctus]
MPLSAWRALLALLLPTLLAQGEARRREATRAGAATGPALLRLSHHLLENYRKGVRPVRDWRTPTTVSIDVIVYAILSVDEKNQVLTTYIWYRQYWNDEFLQWNPEDFDNITKLSIPTDSIWVPDILINEFVDVGKSPNIPYVYVRHHGEVQNYKPLQVVTACSLDIYNFPFDVQNCSLTFTSWLHTIQDINISLWRLPEKVKDDKSIFMNQGEWELLGVLAQFREFSIESSDCYAEMKFYVVIRRRPLFYVVSLLLPSIFLMVMDIVGFYLPPDSGERVSFKVTLLLGYSVFLIIVSDTLPATAIGTPLIGVYFVVCMALLVLSLAETILIVRLVHKQDLQQPVPAWLRRLVLERVAALLCLGEQSHSHRPPAPSQATKTEDWPAMGNHCSHLGGPCDSEKTPRGRASPPPPPPREASLAVRGLLQELAAIRHFLEKRDESRQVARDWLRVGSVLDRLLFRIYLLAVLAYTATLLTLWSIWQYS